MYESTLIDDGEEDADNAARCSRMSILLLVAVVERDAMVCAVVDRPETVVRQRMEATRRYFLRMEVCGLLTADVYNLFICLTY